MVSHAYLFILLTQYSRALAAAPVTPSLLTYMDNAWISGDCKLRVPLPANLSFLAAEWNVPATTVALASAWVPCELGPQYSADVGAVYLIAKGMSEGVASASFRIALEYARKYENFTGPEPLVSWTRHPYLDWFSASPHKFGAAFRARLAHLLLGHDSAGVGEPSDVLSTFLAAHPEWNSPNSSYILFRDHPLLAGKMVRRIQLSGVCSYHSVFVALSYLLQLTGAAHTMVDISHYLLAHMDSEHIGTYLFGGGGAYPETVVNHAYQPALGSKYPSLLHMGDQSSDFALLALRLQSGPAIASFPRLGSHFNDLSMLSYEGHLAGFDLPGHSMLVVGVRFDTASSQYSALLQNWWDGKELVAMREDYWRECGASAFFVKTPQTELRSNLKTFGSNYAFTTVENARVPNNRRFP